VPFTFVRPVDVRVFDERPILDIGTGDGQTLDALIPGAHDVVAIDRSFEMLRTSGLSLVVCADARVLPFRDNSLRTVLAADLFHHLDDEALLTVLRETRRTLKDRGRLVAWWYAAAATPAPDAPRFPRTIDVVATALGSAGFSSSEELELDIEIGGGPPTVGLLGRS